MLAVLGDVPHGLQADFVRCAAQWFSTDGDGAAGGRFHAAEHLEQLRLTVARNPGHAEDFTGFDLEGDIGQPLHAAVVNEVKAGDGQRGFARLRRGLVDLEQDFAAHHHFGQFLG